MTDLCRNLKIKGGNSVRFIRNLAQSYEKNALLNTRDSLREDNLKVDKCQLEKDKTYFLLFTKNKPNKQQKCEQGIRNGASSNWECDQLSCFSKLQSPCLEDKDWSKFL